MKLFKTHAIAYASIRRQGIHGIPHEILYMDAAKSGYYVRFIVDNIDDLNELLNRGFDAKRVKA